MEAHGESTCCANECNPAALGVQHHVIHEHKELSSCTHVQSGNNEINCHSDKQVF